MEYLTCQLRLLKQNLVDRLTWARYYLNSLYFLSKRKFKKKKLVVLYLYADTKKYPDTFERLHKRILKHILGFDITIIKIDNFDESKKEKRLSKGIFDIGGDNSFWEFSGWAKGIKFAIENNYQADVALFVNDAFLNQSHRDKYEFQYITRFNTISLYDLSNQIVGFVDDYFDSKFELLGHDVSNWIRSNIFALPFKIASQIQFPYLSHHEIDRLVPLQFCGEVFKESAPMNQALRKFLNYWILSGWQQSRPINQENWQFMRAKLIAILNERMLTVSIRKMNLRIVNIRENRIVSRRDHAKAQLVK